MKRFFTALAFTFSSFVIAQAAPKITVAPPAPNITNVTVAPGNYKIGDIIVLTITTTAGTPTGIYPSSLVNGVLPTTFSGSGPYTIVYQVGSGNTNRATLGSIPISINLTSARGNS